MVAEECGKLYQLQKQSAESPWSLPENFQLSLEDVSGEVRARIVLTRTRVSLHTFQIVVSGVYLRLFVANPGWVLRKPKQFMEVRHVSSGGNTELAVCRTCWRTCSP